MSQKISGTEWGMGLTALVLALVGFWVPGTGPAPFELDPKPPNHLRAVTWNIGGSGNRGRPADDLNLPAIAAHLQEMNPDIVLLQELRSARQARQLRTLLGTGWRLSLARGNGDRRVAIFCQRGILKTNRYPRKPNFLHAIYQPENGPSVALINVHANLFSSRQRNELLGKLASRIQDQPHALLGGDLNLDVDFQKRGDLFTDNLHRDVESYNYLCERFRDLGLGTGSTAEPDRRLDYLFASKSGFILQQAGPLKNRRRMDMDHDPLIADLAWQTTNVAP